MQEVIIVSMYVGKAKVLAGTAQVNITGDNIRDATGVIVAQNALVNELISFDYSTSFDYTSLGIDFDNLTEAEAVRLAQNLWVQLDNLAIKEEYLELLLTQLQSIGLEEEEEVSFKDRYAGLIEELYEIGVLV